MGRSYPLFYRVSGAVARLLMRSVARLRWQRVDNFPKEGAFLAVGNHVSNADGLTLLHLLLDQKIPARILAKHELWRIPVLSFFLRRSGQVPVVRGSARAVEALSAAFNALEKGEVIALFPEGTLTSNPDLWPMTAKLGAARLALASRVPVIPVGQWGAHALYRREGGVPRFWRRPRIVARVGKPVELSDLYGRTDAAAYKEATHRIILALTSLVEELRGEQAPMPMWDSRRDGRTYDTSPRVHDVQWNPLLSVPAEQSRGGDITELLEREAAASAGGGYDSAPYTWGKRADDAARPRPELAGPSVPASSPEAVASKQAGEKRAEQEGATGGASGIKADRIVAPEKPGSQQPGQGA
ncbi:lysophospholipid acyltransferase family protein [Buchananella felis]|uniref:lysophospholipid acyltransferase family protein n=1 Tax=Buchananella felis TaxID=3231492 RepID=UPI00352930EA